MATSDTSKPSPIKKTRLGRGLGSLLGESNSPITKSNEIEIAPLDETPVVIERNEKTDSRKYQEAKIWKIDIEKLSANKQQPRKYFEKDKLRELSESIKIHGIMSPIIARKKPDGGFEIIAGERRWRASQLAGLKQVPVILKEIENKQSLELALIENIQRHDLNPIEEGHAYKRLMEDYGLTQAEAAERLGKERSTIANAVRLLLLPAEITQYISEGRLSAGHAKVLLGLGDPKRQIEVANQIVEENLSVRKTEELVKEAVPAVAKAKSNKSGDAVAELLIKTLQEDLQKAMGTKVDIDYRKAKGKISIHFYSDEQLNHVSERLKEAWQK